MMRLTTSLARIAAAFALVAAPTSLAAQWSTTYEQFYLQAPHNWQFRTRYLGADRLFNAFDYGHAILYETLWNEPDAPASKLEVKQYDYLTKQVLVRPPRVPLEEGAIEIRYAQLAPEAKAMFEWAHILHRQIYDVLADERLSDARKDAEVQRLIAYYKTRRDLAFSSRPKSMELMQEQPYSLAFRQKYPKFNGLIWAYHWMQVGLYEPLMVGRNSEERQLGVRATVARFWQMLGDAPRTMPHQMPMTAAVAPTFTARYPEAAIIFDNLHSMHDVISDILANPSVPRDRKRAEIMRAARLFRDDTSYVMPVEGWRTMAREMGIENMGGPAVGFLPELPTPTVTYGAVMEHDRQTGKMVGMKVGQMTGAHGSMPGMSGMQHGDSARSGGTMPGMHHGDTSSRADSSMHHGSMQHGGMTMPDSGAQANDSAAAMLREMHERMLQDPTIRARVMADPELRAHQQHLETMGAVDSAPRASARQPASGSRAAPKKSTTRPVAKPATKAPAKPTPKPADPHAGHNMPGMKPASRDTTGHQGHQMP